MATEEMDAGQPDDELVDDASENIYCLLTQLPLFDELYLGMQAMNVGLVDHHLEQMEQDLWNLACRGGRRYAAADQGSVGRY